MIVQLTDLVETTAGRTRTPEVESLLYGVGASGFYPVLWSRPETPVPVPDWGWNLHLNTIPEKVVTLAPDTQVVRSDGSVVSVDKLTVGDTVARFTRLSVNEKYSGMRVTPFHAKRTLEHRFVWEAHNNTTVPVGYSIDHIDGDSFNNHHRNLRAMTISSHSRMTAQRQRFRNTSRNADGSFRKSETRIRRASAPKPIPEHLDMGKLTNICKVVDKYRVSHTSEHWVTPEAIDVAQGNRIIIGGLIVAV